MRLAAVNQSGCIQYSFFLIKIRLFSKTIDRNPLKISLQETLDINYYYHYCYGTFIDCQQRKIDIIWIKKAN